MSDPHASTADTGYLGASELIKRLARGQTTSGQLVDALIERVAAIDDAASATSLRSVAALSADAREVAAQRDAERASGHSRGVLHGVPVLIKDNIEGAGLPGAAGSTALASRPARDAPLVGRLRDAGAIVLGSTNLSQWANFRSTRSSGGWSALGGLVANPWALDRSAGGSSSGSGAALAAGLAPLAVGTETDGSIVCPSSVNGVVGLKPTVGQVPTKHVVPVSVSQDSPGPMARGVDDVALLYSVLSGREPAGSVAPPTVAYAVNWRTGHGPTDAHVDAVVAWLEDAGVRVVRRELAEPGDEQHKDEFTVMLAEFRDDFSAYLADRPGVGVRSLADVIAYEDEHADVEQTFFDHDIFNMAAASGGRAGADYDDARRRNLAWAVETCLTPGLEGVDAVVAPAFAPTWKTDLIVGGHPGQASVATTAPAIAGWPILSVPVGLIHDLPVGLAVLGRPNSEDVLLEVARRVEGVVAAASPLGRPGFIAARRG